jgi:hypothetical protein
VKGAIPDRRLVDSVALRHELLVGIKLLSSMEITVLKSTTPC